MIKLTAITQETLDRAHADTPLDAPCILLDGRHKLSLAQACDIHRSLGEMIANQFEASKASLRTRLELAAASPDPSRAREQAGARPAPPAPTTENRIIAPPFVGDETVKRPTGRQIRRAREATGLSIRAAAEAADICRSTLARVELGSRPLKRWMLMRLEKVIPALQHDLPKEKVA